jgi:phage shock protein PspC (stress-responsive transcriptional regulator)
MNRFSKLALILAGYVGAMIAAYVGVALMEPSDPVEASGGMQAFGDFLSFFVLFGLFSLALTAVALYHLRESEKFWRVFSSASLVFAATGPILALLARGLSESDSLLVGFFALLRVLATPVLCLAFFVFAFIAPSRRARKFLLASAALEVVAGGYAFFCLAVLGHWLV